MPIVDAQVHIWSGGKPRNPSHRQVDAFSKDELLKEMDAAGVDAALKLIVDHLGRASGTKDEAGPERMFWRTDIRRLDRLETAVIHGEERAR
jgi:hypothetical protein